LFLITCTLSGVPKNKKIFKLSATLHTDLRSAITSYVLYSTSANNS